jgi:rhodanese-related sulfurtransferase
MTTSLTAEHLKASLDEGTTLALIDVREPAEYNLAHIASACSVPRRLLEYRIRNLVPFRGTRMIVCDDDGRRAALAAETLREIGYTDVAILQGGLNRWVTQGLGTEWGVNVPSKEFGERVLIERHVPEIGPDELNEMIKRDPELLILDSRTPEEHKRACIPGSRSVPGGELGLRIWDLIRDPERPVVVHCAGRTRSIIGAATLQRLGIKKVFALKNGTMGWELAGLQLERGSDRVGLSTVGVGSLKHAESSAVDLAKQEGVRLVDVAGLSSLVERSSSENLYFFDVRSMEEYVSGHIPGFQWAPGGQLVQATDNYVAVARAPIVVSCDGRARACLTASWLRQMGFNDVFAVDGGTNAWQAAGLRLQAGAGSVEPEGYQAALARVNLRTPVQFHRLIDESPAPLVLFVGTSDEFSAGHIDGSRWLSRSWLELKIADLASPDQLLLITSADGGGSILAAATLMDLGYKSVTALEGGTAAWQLAGLPLEAGLAGVTQAPDDVLPARRSYAEMLNYLRWEEELGERYRRKV